MFLSSKMTNEEILNAYDENEKCLTLGNEEGGVPEFLEPYQYGDERPPDGHEALQGYLIGEDDMINEMLGLMKKIPNVPEEFKQAACDLIRKRLEFHEELSERWWANYDDGVDFGGYKGISVDMYDIS